MAVVRKISNLMAKVALLFVLIQSLGLGGMSDLQEVNRRPVEPNRIPASEEVVI